MKIQDYSFGKIIIDGKRYTSDVILYSDYVEDKWWRKKGHELHEEDISVIIDKNPEILIIGTGNLGYLKISKEIKKYIESKGIEIKIAKTTEACKLFNEFSGQKNVIAALHLTC